MKNILITILFITLMVSSTGLAQGQNETEKINFLIGSIEDAKGMKFIRNGTDYDGKTAADHLRSKLRFAGDKVKTAEDFIICCASKSSMSGEPYRIKFPDGTIMDSEIYFRKQLLTFEKGKK